MPRKPIISDEQLINSIGILRKRYRGKYASYRSMTQLLREEYKETFNKEIPINIKRVIRIIKTNKGLSKQRQIKDIPGFQCNQLRISKWVKWELMRALRKLKMDRDLKGDENSSWEKIAKEIGVSKKTLMRWNNQRGNSRRDKSPSINDTNVSKLLSFLDENKYILDEDDDEIILDDRVKLKINISPFVYFDKSNTNYFDEHIKTDYRWDTFFGKWLKYAHRYRKRDRKPLGKVQNKFRKI